MTSKARTKVADELKLFSCVGARGPLVVPNVMRLLRTMLRFDAGGVLWAGASGLTDAYLFESPELYSLIPHYSSEYCGNRENEVIVGMREALASERGPRHRSQILRVPLSRFYRHGFYGEIMGPAGYHFSMRLMLTDGPRAYAGMNLGRGRRRGDFDEDDLGLLGRLAPFLGHALAPASIPASPDEETASSALLVTDALGRLKEASPVARRLVAEMYGPSSVLRAGQELPPRLFTLIQRLRRLVSHREGDAPPVIDHRNAWGTFRVSAYPLSFDEHGHGSDIGLHIQHRLPLAVRLHEHVRAMRLSPRQAQVCLLSLRGLSESQIAERLGIGVSSVIHHRRQLYFRLGVDCREQMRSVLLRAVADQSPTAACSPGHAA